MNQSLNKKLSVVFFSDIVGYTELMGRDEDNAYQLMKDNLDVHQHFFEKYQGTLIKELGDGVLAIFENAEDALNASIEIQTEWQSRGEIRLRIGLHCGDVIFDRGDVYGDAVNIASRIQSIGVPSCVLFSKQLKSLIKSEDEFPNVKLGEFKLKNVERGLTLFALSTEPLVVPRREEMISTIKYQERKTWRYWVGIGLLISIIAFLIWFINWGESTSWTKDKSIAVLPLKNLNADPSKEYFSDGLTEDIITQLSKINSLRVISRTSTVLYKNSQESNPEIALALGVSTLLEGSVQWSGERLRIRVQLIDANSNQAIWAETFDLEMIEDLFDVQSRIASEIATKLQAEVTLSEIDQINQKPTSSFEAYEQYLKGRGQYYEYQLTNNKSALASFKEAIKIDSTFALAWAGLGDAYAQMYGIFNYPSVWLDSSLYAGSKAIQMDSRLAEGYKAMGVAYYYNNQYQLALEYLEKAVEISPNHAQAIGNLATVYFITGQLDKSLDLQRKAAGLNPKSFIPFQILGWNYRLFENQKQAQNWLRKSISIKPSFDTYEQLGLSFLAEGKSDSVKSVIAQVRKLHNNESSNDQVAGILSYMNRDYENAENYLTQSIEEKDNWESDPYFYAPIYLASIFQSKGKSDEADFYINKKLNEYTMELKGENADKEFAVFTAALYLMKKNKEKAIEFLNLAKDMNFQDYQLLEINPLFDSIRDNPEFMILIEDIKSEIRVMKLNASIKKN
ncbi:tetratricopeptide repeat protein [Algoriphagus sp. SE2]|uniref:adenylate/guanylate cyclase domain-containing protein n=1 Tax=Algoriphagus sp. SE2 TaxID=3141536 RepID=UPI0031CD5DC0